MRTNEYDHIILSDQEVLRQEFYIRSKKGKKASKELLLLTDKRIYFYGRDNRLFRRSMVSRFVNLKAVYAGSRSKGRFPILITIASLLVTLSLGFLFAYSFSLVDFPQSINATLSYIGLGVGSLFALLYFFLTEKMITLEYPGDNLVIHCNRMKEKNLNKMFRLISNAIDQS